VRWRVNPSWRLPPAWLHVVRLWDLSRGGMGRGWLTEAGGVNDQPAWLLGAFNVLGAEQAKIDERRRRV
jgi:hypothetical protein